MTEVLFYHLQRQPLEAVLPKLLELSLDRGWRVVVEAGSEERVEALDAHLWTYADESFLPHGTTKDVNAAQQPVLITTGSDAPNGANVRFFVDGAAPSTIEGLMRAVILFDGNDGDAVEAARAHWRTLKAAGHALTYWQQDGEGRWQKRA